MRTSSKVKQLALFASGTGSNVRNIHSFFSQRPDVHIAVLVCNKKDAPVVSFARDQNISVRLIDKATLYDSEMLTDELKAMDIDLIVLAGFLWLIPQHLIVGFPNRIINLHPALLPKYGGKGMYGKKVHEAVLENGDKESGITIHLVNGRYDEGDILFQATCPVDKKDDAERLSQKIHQLEHEHLPILIDQLLSQIV
jgi:phosphoribosylglycinamide formyltransferase-1